LKLFHFTEKKNLLSIAMRGLTPNVPDLSLTTMGQAVVWLTRQQTMKPTAADIAYLKASDHPEDLELFSESMLLNKDTRLTVNLSNVGKRLCHYQTWMQKTKITAAHDSGTVLTGADVLKLHQLPSIADWFIYFGTVPPHKIELETTAENMLPGVEHNLASAVEEGNAERIASLTKMRDQMKALQLDQALNLVVS
jgi:hypothetical protein